MDIFYENLFIMIVIFCKYYYYKLLNNTSIKAIKRVIAQLTDQLNGYLSKLTVNVTVWVVIQE